MEDTKLIVAERSLEIRQYFGYVRSINEGNFDRTVFKILKANTLLMLYNFVESVVSNSIDAIRKAIYVDPDVGFDQLKLQIKLQILKDLKYVSANEDFLSACNTISKDIISLTFKKERISKGNIDRDVIVSLSEIYGFNVRNSNYRETGHGETLTTIKEKRNDLAHGTFSFAEVGKEYSPDDMELLVERTIKYLEYMVSQVEIYIDTKLYVN